MLVQHFVPAAVAELARALGGADDVGEQDRREHAVVVRRRASARQELLDLLEQAVLVSRPEQMFVAGELDEACPGDL